METSWKNLLTKELKTLAIDRPHVIPLNHDQFGSGFIDVLLIQAHAGVHVCKCITPDVPDGEVERLAVIIYEENFRSL